MDASRLIRYDELSREGRQAEVESAAGRRLLVRVRQGVYAERAEWETCAPEERIRLRAHALAVASRSARPVFAATTAAALWKYPLFRIPEGALHVLAAEPARSRTRAGVVRHAWPSSPLDEEELDGLLVTSAVRTVFDVIRTVPIEAAIACADAALRAVAWRGPGAYDDEAAERFRAALLARLDAAPGARGVRQARFVAEFADGRAQLPGESVSRLWMRRLGVERPVLQPEVRLAGGKRAYPDFVWPRLRLFGEFDGDGKYVDPALTAGRSVRQVLRDQRAREASIVAATGWSPVRWGMERLTDEAAFGRFLRAQRLL